MITLYQSAYDMVSKTKSFADGLFGGFITAHPNDASPLHLQNISGTEKVHNKYEQAIGVLGMEACYWYALSKQILNKDFNSAEPFGMFMNCLVYDGSQYVLLASVDTHIPYHVTLGKKNNFYDNVLQNVIEVRTATGVEKINADELEIKNFLLVHQSYSIIYEHFKNEFNYVLKKLNEDHDYLETLKQYNLQEIVDKVSSKEDLSSYWSENGGLSWDVYYYLIDKINTAMKQEILREKVENEFVRALIFHAGELSDIYYKTQKIAKEKGNYSYPLSQVEQFVLLPEDNRPSQPVADGSAQKT